MYPPSSTKNAKVCWSSATATRDQERGQECSVWLDQGTCPSLEIFMGEMVCKITTRDLHPPKKMQQASQPTSWCQERSKRGELAYRIQDQIIQIIQSACHYDMRHTQSKLLNLPSNLLSEPCKYCLSVLLHLMKLQFLQKLWLLYSKFFANSLRFQRFSSSCEYYIKSKSNKIRRPRNTSTKKKNL